MKNNTLLIKYQKQLDFIQSNAPKASSRSQKSRITRAKHDFSYFVKTYMPHHCMDHNNKLIPIADFHKEFVDSLSKKESGIYLNVWARGHAKTTIIKFYIIWSVVNDNYKNILYVGQSQALAQENIMMIQAELESNELLLDDFGDMITDGEWTKRKFVIKNSIQISALGAGSSPRGQNFRNTRPDLIICDDLDTDEGSRNEETVKHLYNWFKESLYQTVDISKHYKVLLIGNVFSFNMLIANVRDNMKLRWYKKIDAIDEQGEPAWPQKFTIDMLNDKREEIGEISFLREFMNQPITEGSVFKQSNILFKSLRPLSDYDYIITYYDPSISNKSDYKAILSLGHYQKEFHVVDVYLRRSEMREAADYLYQNYLRMKDQNANVLVMMEANFGQGIIHKEYIMQLSDKYGFVLPIIYDESKKANKQQRVETMQPFFSNNLIWFDENKRIDDQKVFIEQLLAFPHSKFDDGPDALESALTNLQKRVSSSRVDPGFVPYERERLY